MGSPFAACRTVRATAPCLAAPSDTLHLGDVRRWAPYVRYARSVRAWHDYIAYSKPYAKPLISAVGVELQPNWKPKGFAFGAKTMPNYLKVGLDLAFRNYHTKKKREKKKLITIAL